MINYFIDTADVDQVKRIMETISNSDHFRRTLTKGFRGITTNPKAFASCQKFTLSEWQIRTKELCQLATEFAAKKELLFLPVVYVQCPNSYMTPVEVLKFAKIVSTWGDGVTRIGLKIPPRVNLLKIVPELQTFCEINVTGVTDAATTMLCKMYGVKYVSIIPGRMEEAGLDPKSHIDFINTTPKSNTEIITGSMRTLNQLEWTIQRNTVPTIGPKVFDLLFDPKSSFIVGVYTPSTICNSPDVDDRYRTLSTDFFSEMDKHSSSTYLDFIKTCQ